MCLFVFATVCFFMVYLWTLLHSSYLLFYGLLSMCLVDFGNLLYKPQFLVLHVFKNLLNNLWILKWCLPFSLVFLKEPTRPAIPILLAVGAVHHHLIQNGLRVSASIVADTAQCFSTHHFACLIGYGARFSPFLPTSFFSLCELVLHTSPFCKISFFFVKRQSTFYPYKFDENCYVFIVNFQESYIDSWMPLTFFIWKYGFVNLIIEGQCFENWKIAFLDN